jgi:Cu(I)/Ag(I) efflux system protein CusF
MFNGKGVVTKVNLELVSVELDHEEIKGLMPKMTMEFYVREKSELEKLKIGDAVDFVLEDNAGTEQIISIKKAKWIG